MEVFSLKKMVEHQPALRDLNETIKLYMEDDGIEVKHFSGNEYRDNEGKSR